MCDREALGRVTLIFHQQLRASIADGKTDSHVLTSILSTLDHLDPFRATNSGELGFYLMAEIINSKYPEGIRYQMAGRVVQLLGKEVYTHPPKYFFPDWIPPLLNFLLLSEKFYTEGSPPEIGSTVLQILLCRRIDANLGPALLPILASILSQDHPL